MEDMNKLVLVLSGIFVVLIGADLVTDYQKGGTGTHLILEGLLLLVSGAMFVAGLKQLTQARQEIKSLQVDVERLHGEKERWKGETQQLLAGLSVKIEGQFKHWNLTQAETEVGFLLLKGFSLKEIADIRNTKLKTVQQQSQAIYQKTKLGSRSELAAFFLEDLLPPTSVGGNSALS
jgi:DNA-binding CsgD family transcriptional regulator